MPLLHFGQVRLFGVICIVYLSPLPLLFLACLQNNYFLNRPRPCLFLTGFNHYVGAVILVAYPHFWVSWASWAGWAGQASHAGPAGLAG